VGQELKMKQEDEEQPLPPGINASDEVVDMAAYERWRQEQEVNTQQQMQRREEVNINVHRGHGKDEPEPGDHF
ncbi:conjugal transfer protein TraD, partial [Salmonella enterica subsp. enterica]|nr:conjugal transfer protein TraD [Salmonella enterica subsp. enterica]